MDNLIIFGAKYLVFIIALIAGWVWLSQPSRGKVRLASAVIVAAVAALVLAKLAGKLYYDPRPFVTHHLKPLVAHSADNGFPSEHTALSMVLASVIYFYKPKVAYVLFGLTLLVGISRVAAHLHSPIDIAGGLVIGALAGWLGYHASQKLLRPAVSQPSGPK